MARIEHESVEEFLARHSHLKLKKSTNIEDLARKTKAPAAAKGTKKPRKTKDEIKFYIPDPNFKFRSEGDFEGARRLVEITLPFPPQTNNLFYTQIQKDGTPLRFKSYPYKKYYEIVRGSAKKIGILGSIGKVILKGDLHIRMKVYRPRNSGDWDGYIKAPQDVLKGWFFDDDGQIVKGVVEKLLDREKPRIEIVIYEVGAQNNLF